MKRNSRILFLFLACFSGFIALAKDGYAATVAAVSPSYADVSAAISQARSGDTVLVPAGSVSWTAQLNITKGIILKGAGADRTVIKGNMGPTLFLVSYAPANPVLNEPFRLTGFTFDMQGSTLALCVGNGDASHPLTNIRIDNNVFTNCLVSGPNWAGLEISGTVRGVMDHNALYGDPFVGFDGNQKAEWDNSTFTYGTTNSFYIEDNVFTSGRTLAASGWGSRYVVRYNTFNLTANSLSPWFDAHGNQGGGVYASMGVEIYGNVLHAPSVGSNSVKVFHHRGGKGLCFCNYIVENIDCGIDVLEEYNDADCPTSRSEPQHVNDSYYWYNRKGGSSTHLPVDYATWTSGGYDAVYIIAPNVDFWYETANFNGTSGVGCGPLASRPATCTTGVGYWATTQSVSSLSSSVGANPILPVAGSLYKATAKDTWTLFYTPLVYPHPLVSGQGGVPATPVISLSPASLAFTADVGGAAPATQTVSLVNGGTTNVLSWTQSDNAAWLQVSPAGGVTPGSLLVSASPTGLAAGTYTGTVTVVSPVASNSPQAVVVTLLIRQPVISLSPGSLSFTAEPGGVAPAPQTVNVINGGTTGVLSWTQSDNAAWLQVSPASGATPGTLAVSVDPSALTVGTYTSSLTVTAPGAANTPQTLVVSLVVATGQQLTGHYDMTYPDRASLLAAGWDFFAQTASGATRNTEQTTGAVVSYDQTQHPGVLRIPADTGDLWADYYNDTRNTLFRDLPSTWTSVRLKLKAFSPSLSSQQAGLAVYQDDDNYAEVYRIYEGANYVGFITEVDQAASVVKFVQGTVSTNLYMRLNRDPATETITGYYALDNTNWITLGSVSRTLTNPRLGIVVGASPSGYPNADVMWVEVYAALPPPPASPNPPMNLRSIP